MRIFIYKDSKHKPFMVYARSEYPYGDYIGHFDTLKEADEAIKKHENSKRGIPLCKALVDFQKDHGAYDMEGLELLQEVE